VSHANEIVAQVAVSEQNDVLTQGRSEIWEEITRSERRIRLPGLVPPPPRIKSTVTSATVSSRKNKLIGLVTKVKKR